MFLLNRINTRTMLNVSDNNFKFSIFSRNSFVNLYFEGNSPMSFSFSNAGSIFHFFHTITIDPYSFLIFFLFFFLIRDNFHYLPFKELVFGLIYLLYHFMFSISFVSAFIIINLFLCLLFFLCFIS